MGRTFLLFLGLCLVFCCPVWTFQCSLNSLQGITIKPGQSSLLRKSIVSQPLRSSLPAIEITESGEKKSRTIVDSVVKPIQLLWDFSRPHTLVGSGLSIISLFLFAVPVTSWKSPVFLQSLLFALIPSMLMNIYITGLNQVTDVDIDKINKPYLPIAAGRLKPLQGVNIILTCLAVAVAFAWNAAWPLRWTLLGSAFLGTIYSLPPFRLKRYPLLAAFCILVVRGSLVNLGFFLQAKMAVLDAKIYSLDTVLRDYPQSIWLTAFFAIFGVIIALLKDVPDTSGDRQYSIPTFSVRMGPRKMLKMGSGLLVALLSSSALAVFGSTVLNFRRQKLASSLAIPSISSLFPRLFVGLGLAAMALDVLMRAGKVDSEDSNAVYSYYMHVWKIFYACYLLLPALR